jgi:hypothetical protein
VPEERRPEAMFDHRGTLALLVGILTIAGTSEPSGRADLAAVAGSSEPDAAGHVELTATARGSRLEIVVSRVDPCAPLALYVDDGTGTMLASGVLPPGRTDRRLVFDTARGDELPAGARSAADLAGRFLEIRDGDGSAILVGSLPPPGGAPCPT